MAQKKGLTACSLNDLTFPVELVDNPAYTNQEYSKIVRGIVPVTVPYFNDEEMGLMVENLTKEELAEMIANNPKTKEIVTEMDLNYCSPRYELVPNDTIFPKVEEILKANKIDYTAHYAHSNHVRFYAKFIIEDERFAYKMKGTNDVIKFIWEFQHSYNGLTKYKGVCGFHRLVCTNGLTVPIQEMTEFNLALEGKHTSSILHSLDEFDSILVNLTNSLDVVSNSITTKYEGLNSAEITNLENRIEEVLKAAKITSVANSKLNTVDNIIKRIEKESNLAGLGYDGKVTDWLVYNGINAYINDNSLNIASPEKRKETDSKVLEYMLQTV